MTTIPAGGPRHQLAEQRTSRQLAFFWMRTFRWHLLALFLSDLGKSMIERKYDAFTTDNGYSAEPTGTNRVARWIDGMVRRRDTHVALRQRLQLVVNELVATTLTRSRTGDVRLVSAPVGLGRDLREAWQKLEKLRARPTEWLEVIGIDLDASGTVLAETSRLAMKEGIPLETYQLDLLDSEGLGQVECGSVDVFNTIGLSTWLDEPALRQVLGAIKWSLAPDGVLLIDHWRHHGGSRYVEALDMPARYVTDEEFESTLSACGYAIEQKQATANEIVVVFRARPR